ncbi:hypothetical protein BDV26DRAFT_279988 [Aspergillus bertholletiae]|uniref:DUF7514 domain-containing protein n=1 Tax=Aspergillus bertholletiae TaxID=1226010 RepID=A0A5N7BDS3_9EURO|nr:hypothetical protein BDV26DRAFT_279988 [Aspergillus bertholletiae]
MAYDGYQNNSAPFYQPGNANQMNPNEHCASSYTPPYPSQYGPERLNMPQPQIPPPLQANPYAEVQPSPPQPNNWQQPYDGRINEAVNSAFHKADTSTYLSPEVLTQITANVIQQLKETGLENLQSGQYQPRQPPPRPPKQWATETHATYSNDIASSPGMATQDTSASSPHVTYENPAYQPRPPSSMGYSGSPHPQARTSPAPPPERRGSPASQMSEHSQRMESRPKPPSREATVTELTTLERIWGTLFEDGKPTRKLSQFLRGVAVHLIEDYEPKNSLVILPTKLQKFYEDTKVPGDYYPWKYIFDDETSHVSRLFREVRAEHHLVQEENQLRERPYIPGLTPRGFETWATLMIQVNPETEYKRLQKAVLNMPISNPDNRKERFPKEIPQSLFPFEKIRKTELQGEVKEFIKEHCSVDLDKELEKFKAHHEGSTTSTAASGPSHSERERKPYQASVSTVVDSDDEELNTPSRPIERQRKPYTAHPGGGKEYDGFQEPAHRHTSSFSTGSIPRDTLVPSEPRVSESQGLDPTYFRPSSTQPPSASMGRSRSPPRGSRVGSEYRHSDGDLLGHNGSSGHGVDDKYYYRTSASTSIGDMHEDDRFYRGASRDDDQRLYESLREREREREKNKYNDYLPHRSSWDGEEGYYRDTLGNQGDPVESGSGYDYKTYIYK